MPKIIPPITGPSGGVNAPIPQTLLPPNFGLISVQTGWRNTWTHIVAGKFSKSSYSSLLFYERNNGYAEFYTSDGQGGIAFLASHSGWRKSWTHIVSGAFFGPDRTGLLFYDQEAGNGAIYDTNEGNLVNVREYSWRTRWTHITTVRLPGGYEYNSAIESGQDTAVVFYDQAAGHGEIYKCNASGELSLIMESDGWRTSWTHVIGDSVAGVGLLFYEGSTSYGEIYEISQDENTKVYSFGTQVAKGELPQATDIIPGNFGWQDTGYLFYDRPSGKGTFIYNNTGGLEPDTILVSAETYTGWSASWNIIVPGEFWAADPEDVKFRNGFTDLLFYNRESGYGEFYFHEPFQAIQSDPLEGYAFPQSVIPGETVGFYVNKQSYVGPIAITIYRQDAEPNGTLMATLQNIQQYRQAFSIGQLDYRDGPEWPPAAEFVIPQDWPSGLYLARVEAGVAVPLPPFQGSATKEAHPRSALYNPTSYGLLIPFVVRAAVPGSQSRILLYIPDATYEAYNFWGGRSLYGFTSMGAATWSYGSPIDAWPNYVPPRAFAVSFARPYKDAVGLPKWQYWEVPLIRWLARNGIAVELCTATDLHKDWANQAGFLQNYGLLVSVGHDEYWSTEMRDNVESFAAAGGNVVFFGGNVCWWQVRFDLDVMREICYKDAGFDPYALTEPSLTTCHWWGEPVCRPETSLTGVGWANVNQQPEYHALQPNHWAFNGLNFTTASTFGCYTNASGLTSVVNTGETDAIQRPHGPGPGPQASPCPRDTPSNFLSLAQAMSSPTGEYVAATMGLFAKGKGQVFTVGAENWSLGLSQVDGDWNEMDQITLNVLEQLS